MKDYQPSKARTGRLYSAAMATKRPNSGATMFRPTYSRIKLLASTRDVIRRSDEVLCNVRVK